VIINYAVKTSAPGLRASCICPVSGKEEKLEYFDVVN